MWTRSFAFVSILSFSSAARFGDSGRLFAISRRQPLETETSAKKISFTDDILQLRGGAGPLDPSTVMKTASVIGCIQGLVAQFAPIDTAIMYGHDEER